MTALHIARMDLPEVRAMAELFPIDQIFDNAAYPGILANAFIDAGIPAFTPEIGASRILNHDMIPLFVEGTMNVLKHHGIIAGPMGRTGKDTSLFVGNSAHPVLATRGGFVELLVKLNDKVDAGQGAPFSAMRSEKSSRNIAATSPVRSRPTALALRRNRAISL